MNNDLETIWKEASWPNQGTMLEFVWRDHGKPQKTSVRIASVPAKTQTECLPNTSLLSFCLLNQFHINALVIVLASDYYRYSSSFFESFYI
jgi:hypothetical protein